MHKTRFSVIPLFSLPSDILITSWPTTGLMVLTSFLLRPSCTVLLLYRYLLVHFTSSPPCQICGAWILICCSCMCTPAVDSVGVCTMCIYYVCSTCPALGLNVSLIDWCSLWWKATDGTNLPHLTNGNRRTRLKRNISNLQDARVAALHMRRLRCACFHRHVPQSWVLMAHIQLRMRRLQQKRPGG